MNKRFSKKRQAIIDCLRSTDTHPGAEWVYEKLKPVYPDLSLGTVYRNLKELAESGEIISVGHVDGTERFDGNVYPHAHAVCKVCGKVTDITELQLPESMVKMAESLTEYKVVYSGVKFTGICPECLKNDSLRSK